MTDPSKSSSNGGETKSAKGNPAWTAKWSTQNFFLLAFYQVVLRVGWIFKTETVVMPAVLDFLGGGGMIRGCLPLMNRICQTVPSLLLVPYMQSASRKKPWIVGVTVLMATCFGGLALCFTYFGEHRVALQWVFLAVYGLFFVATGMNQILFSTLQGKLVSPGIRGRLLLTSNLIGGSAAVGAVWLLMPGWLSADGAQFAKFFVTSTVAFLTAGLLALLIVEPRRRAKSLAMTRVGERFRDSVAPIKTDMNFRKLAIVAALFGASLIIFPHYQALGRGGDVGGDYRSLLLWLTVQNVGTMLFSFVVGPLADRCGNRSALRLALAGVAASPIVALILAAYQIQWAYPLVFVLVGLNPVVVRLLMNYTLEASSADKHPSYLVSVSLAISMPVICSPLAGFLVDQFGYQPVFVGVTFCGIAGWWIAAGLYEPRHHEPLESV